MTRDRQPAKVGVGVTMVPAIASVMALSGFNIGLIVSIPAILLALTGMLRGSRYLLGFGVAGLFGAILATGAVGYRPSLLLVAGIGAVLTWDIGEHAIGIGEHLGRAAQQRRLVLVHAVSSTAIGVGALSVILVAFSVAPRTYSQLVVILLLTGLVALVAALRFSR